MIRRAPFTVWLIAAVVLTAGSVLARGVSRIDTGVSNINIETTESKITAEQKMTQTMWDISESEYARYKQLMAGPRGAFSATNISPLEVLGLHAQTADARRRYAEKYVHIVYRDVQRVVAWERAVADAMGRFRTQDMTNMTTRRQRLALFVAVDVDRCRECLKRARQLARSATSGLDIYIVDSNDDDRIRAWAKKAGIEPKDVVTRRITLNKGVELFARYGAGKKLPTAFVRAPGGVLMPIPAGPGGRQP